MLKNLLKNWKTTSAGLAMIISSVIHLVFAVLHNTADESTWTTAVMGIVGGVGLLAAGDSTTSAAAHDETKAALTAMSQTIATTADAAAKGDSDTLTKVATAPLPVLGVTPPAATPPKTS